LSAVTAERAFSMTAQKAWMSMAEHAPTPVRHRSCGASRPIEACCTALPDPEGDELAAALTGRLTNDPVSDVVGFAEQLSWALRLDRKEYGDDLSSDRFLYTRAAVVAAGREEHESVLRGPEGFMPYAGGLVWARGLLYVPNKAYKHLTGDEGDRNTRYSYESCSDTAGWTGA
jgi:hypothetical protein